MDYDRKLILIPAVPSSGTSALAGTLEHLGVYMGKVDKSGSLEKRGYEMFEDLDLWRYTASPNPDHSKLSEGKLSRTILRLRSYINFRIVSDPPGPIGAKIPGVLCTYDPDPETLDIVTLNVHRPFEKCLLSDRNTMIRAGKYEEISDSWEKVAAFNRLRAGDMGACVSGKMDLFRYHDPVVNVTFDDLVEKKEDIVPKIVEALGLESTDEEIQAAIGFLDKDKKHS
jgi:hypothetical protein